MDRFQQEAPQAPHSPLFYLAPDLSLSEMTAEARSLAPTLAGDPGLLRGLLRTRPDLIRLLGEGQCVSLRFTGEAAGPLMVSVFPFGENGYWGILTPPAAEAALSQNFTSQLREPITELFALLPQLARQMDPGQDPGVLDQVNRCCYQLLRSTNLLSQLSLLADAGWAPSQATDLSAVTRGVCDAASRVLLPGHPPLRWRAPQDALPVACSAPLLATLLCALLANALQFTRDGNQISVSLRRLSGRALLRVQDQGTGILPETLPHIFEPFFSADPFGDGAPGPGPGLGLTFVQALAGRLGGTVSVESVFGEGTSVAVGLPLAEPVMSAVLTSTAADYLVNRYSPVYVQLCGFCRLPDLS